MKGLDLFNMHTHTFGKLLLQKIKIVCKITHQCQDIYKLILVVGLPLFIKLMSVVE